MMVGFRIKFISFLFLSGISFFSFSQKISPAYLGFKVGVNGFLSDLDGTSSGQNLNILNLPKESVKYAIGVNYNKQLTKTFFLRADLNNALLHASDKYSENAARKERNLSVSTFVNELNLMVEKSLIFSNAKKIGKGKHRIGYTHAYVFGGVGLIYFNPKSHYKSQLYALQPLGTEGQTINPGSKPYSRFSPIIPFGVGVKRKFYDNSYIGIELCFRQVFTDYLDDVSTSYPDNNALRSAEGAHAAKLSDPNPTKDRYAAGTPRGNSLDKDKYFFLQITYGINISKVGKGLKGLPLPLGKCFNF